MKGKSEEDNLIIDGLRFPLLRQQTAGSGYKSLADYVNSDEDYIGVFMAGAGRYIDSERKRLEKAGDSYKALLIQSLSDRLAEATSEYLHYLVRKEYWGYAADEKIEVERILRGEYQGIRPAMGYPMLPDQLLNRDIFTLLEPESSKRVEITENGAMSPTATVSGLYISHPNARYFMIGTIGEDQLTDYAKRRGMTRERVSEILNS